MPVFHLGIDVAKLTIDVALLIRDAKPKQKSFANTPSGFLQLASWLRQNLVTDPAELHACLEATGSYGDALARYLVSTGHKVSVVNPLAIRAFARTDRTELSRTKTDKADAARIARFCRLHQHQPEVWIPPAEEIATLQALVRRLDALRQMYQMEQQRKEAEQAEQAWISQGVASGTPEMPNIVASSIEAVLTLLQAQITQVEDQVEEQIREHVNRHPTLKEQSGLLESIPGIGHATATTLLCELADWSRFDSARAAAAAYAGLVPRQHQSGTSVRGRSALSKLGNARLRKALYFPAITAIRFNPVIQAMAARLKASGKRRMQIVGAAMRRLVHLAYGVLKSGKPFDANIAMRQA